MGGDEVEDVLEPFVFHLGDMLRIDSIRYVVIVPLLRKSLYTSISFSRASTCDGIGVSGCLTLYGST